MPRTIKQTKAIKRQGQGRRWFSIAEYCRDMYVMTKEIGYLHEYHHAMSLSMFHYRAARICVEAEQRFVSSVGFEIETRIDAIYD